MITEDYVSFETAKLLKDKGFDDEYTNAFYDKTGNLYFIDLLSDLSNHPDNDTDIAASTLYVSMKWLREVHNLEIYPFHDAIQENNDWWYRIEHHSKGCSLTEYESDAIYKTYEESCESAIKYCLENLI